MSQSCGRDKTGSDSQSYIYLLLIVYVLWYEVVWRFFRPADYVIDSFILYVYIFIFHCCTILPTLYVFLTHMCLWTKDSILALQSEHCWFETGCHLMSPVTGMKPVVASNSIYIYIYIFIADCYVPTLIPRKHWFDRRGKMSCDWLKSTKKSQS